MPRPPRVDVGNEVYHVINRGNNRSTIFETDADYLLFEALLEDMALIRDMRILAYCLMPNHWHLVLYPRKDKHLSDCMRWLCTTHVRRWHKERGTHGGGHLYQGRYKSFLIEQDRHLLQVIRYVEQNPLRAKLVKRAEEWKYSSLADRLQNRPTFLTTLMTSLPKNYRTWVNTLDTDVDRIRTSVVKEQPFGSDRWVDGVANTFSLHSTFNSPGRPRNTTPQKSAK